MNRPSFQFYPKDWLADPNVVVMTAEERGAYIQLLALMWNTSNCSLTNNKEYLSKLAKVDINVITSILPCFIELDDSIRHKRLDEERTKQDIRRKILSESGQKGMENRWGGKRCGSGRKKNQDEKLEKPLENKLENTANEKTSTVSESYKVDITNDNSSTSSSTSSSNNKEKKKRKKEIDPKQKESMNKFLFMVFKQEKEFSVFLEKMSQAQQVASNIIRNEVIKFVNHWTEKKPDGFGNFLPKWELQDGFEVNKRLSTWLINARSYGHFEKKNTATRIIS